MMGCTTAPGEKAPAPARAPHKDHTYELVSKVAYLIGVPLRIFENESCKQKSIAKKKKVPQNLRDRKRA